MHRRKGVAEKLAVLLKRLAQADPVKFREIYEEISSMNRQVHQKFTAVLDGPPAVNIMFTNDDDSDRTRQSDK